MTDSSDDEPLFFGPRTSSTTIIVPDAEVSSQTKSLSYFQPRDAATVNTCDDIQRAACPAISNLGSARTTTSVSSTTLRDHRMPSLTVPSQSPSQGRWSSHLPPQDNDNFLSSAGPRQRAVSLHEAKDIRPLRSQKSKLSMNEGIMDSENKKHEEKKGGKKGFLERIGLRRNRRHEDEQQQHPVDRHIANIMSGYNDGSDGEEVDNSEEEEEEEEEDEEDGETDHTVGSSSKSSIAARNSIDSSQSAPQAPGSLGSHRDYSSTLPHNGIPVKVKSKHKTNIQEWPSLYLAQTLTVLPKASSVDRSRRPSHDMQENQLHNSHPYGATWTMKFSKDGKYMASAGQFCNIYLWKVLNGASTAIDRGTINVFEDTPCREYHGHLADVLDISWSKNNFIVSASMDKTVRLWHVSREECLGVFPHLDIVTAVAFHPKDDRFFLSGSLDSRLRLWNIPDKKVAFWNELQNGSMITAVAFTLDGKTACAGSHIGQCFFYETQGLKYNTQLDIRLNKRSSKKGRKITGIEPMPNTMPGDERILITSNDSKARLYNMKDKSLMFKYKGPHNLSMQIRATFSDDGRNIVCGSEDGHVYIIRTQPTTYLPFHHWPSTDVALSQFETNEDHVVLNNNPQAISTSPRMTSWLKRGERRGEQDKLRIHSEYFEAHQHIATVAIFAPTRTRQILARTGDDIIFNNTPVEIASASDELEQWSQWKNTSIMRRSLSGNDQIVYQDEEIETMFEEEEIKRKEARSTYAFPTGQIIVSANDAGCIKVWRMDSGVYDTITISSPQQHQVKKIHDTRHQRSNSLDISIGQQHQGTSKSTTDSSSKANGKRHHLSHLFSSVGRHNKP